MSSRPDTRSPQERPVVPVRVVSSTAGEMVIVEDFAAELRRWLSSVSN